jgi:hypothetical protein
MRQLSTTIIFLLSCFISVGQNKTVSIPISLNSDTTYWYKWLQKYSSSKGLSDLSKNADSLHFRITTLSQAVDVWTNDYKNFKGIVTVFIKCVSSQQVETNKTISIRIDTSIARKIYDLVKDNNIFTIPTDEKINGWSQGFDGIEVLIEYSTPNFYSFKQYWTPCVFKDIKEAQAIDTTQRQVWQLVSNLHLPKYHLNKGCEFEHSGITGVPIKNKN